MLNFRIRLDNLSTRAFEPPPVDPDEMVMDAQTYKDLEIFEGEVNLSLARSRRAPERPFPSRAEPAPLLPVAAPRLRRPR
jgi:hypothetical protein